MLGFILFLIISIFCYSNTRNNNECLDPTFQSQMNRIFEKRQVYFKKSIESAFHVNNTNIIYNIQEFTNNLLEYAISCNDTVILEGLIDVFMDVFSHLQLMSEYVYYYLPGYKRTTTLPLDPPSMMWIDGNGIEVVLYSSQFLYEICRCINGIIQYHPDFMSSTTLKTFVDKYAPVLYDTYRRWIFADRGNHRGIFQTKGWGCSNGVFNHLKFIIMKGNNQFGDIHYHKYCNMITDSDLWILSGATTMVATNDIFTARYGYQLFPITDSSKWKNYITSFVSIIKSHRLTDLSLQNFQHVGLTGLNFDLGYEDDFPDYAYAGYNGKTFPTLKDKKPGKNVGWDISHGRRFVHVFNTLYRFKDHFDLPFPSESDMTEITNQFIYGVFLKDFTNPKFTNFFDGTNGWFRVGYGGKPNFGYPPSGLCDSGLTGGYNFWSKFNNDVMELSIVLMNMTFQTTFRSEIVIGNDIRYAENVDAMEVSEGKIGRGVQFDGVKSQVLCDYGPELEVKEGSFAFWFKTSKKDQVSDILDLYEDGYSNFVLIRLTSENNIMVLMKVNGKEMIVKQTEPIIDLSDWIHVVVTHDSLNLTQIYLNGKSVSSSGVDSDNWINELSLAGCSIGKAFWEAFEGTLDEMFIFTRSIEADEVFEIYKNNSVKNEEGLFAHWSFEEVRNEDLKKTFLENYAFKGYSKIDGLNMLQFYPSFAKMKNDVK